MRRRIGTALLVGGSAAVVWCLTVLASASLYQWYENRRLERPSGVVSTPAGPKLHDVIGRLAIPRLGVSTVVIEGDDDSTLRLGAGHVPWTALPDEAGNVGIAAHRDTFFRPLHRIVRNDQIIFTTPHGTFNYAVEWTEIVRPDDVSVLNTADDNELTLITCYPFHYIGSAPLRFVVHARLIGEPNRADRGHLPA